MHFTPQPAKMSHSISSDEDALRQACHEGQRTNKSQGGRDCAFLPVLNSCRTLIRKQARILDRAEPLADSQSGGEALHTLFVCRPDVLRACNPVEAVLQTVRIVVRLFYHALVKNPAWHQSRDTPNCHLVLYRTLVLFTTPTGHSCWEPSVRSVPSRFCRSSSRSHERNKTASFQSAAYLLPFL